MTSRSPDDDGMMMAEGMARHMGIWHHGAVCGAEPRCEKAWWQRSRRYIVASLRSRIYFPPHPLSSSDGSAGEREGVADHAGGRRIFSCHDVSHDDFPAGGKKKSSTGSRGAPAHSSLTKVPVVRTLTFNVLAFLVY